MIKMKSITKKSIILGLGGLVFIGAIIAIILTLTKGTSDAVSPVTPVSPIYPVAPVSPVSPVAPPTPISPVAPGGADRTPEEQLVDAGYTFYQGRDRRGDDIFSLPVSKDLLTLMIHCNNYPTCIGFNTNGWLKRAHVGAGGYAFACHGDFKKKGQGFWKNSRPNPNSMWEGGNCG